jgi:hypothetical protein
MIPIGAAQRHAEPRPSHGNSMQEVNRDHPTAQGSDPAAHTAAAAVTAPLPAARAAASNAAAAAPGTHDFLSHGGPRVINHLGYAPLAGAVDTAEEGALRFDAVADDPAPAVVADRRQLLDRALEAVEDVPRASRDHLERQVVVVPAHLALRHGRTHQNSPRECNDDRRCSRCAIMGRRPDGARPLGAAVAPVLAAALDARFVADLDHPSDLRGDALGQCPNVRFRPELVDMWRDSAEREHSGVGEVSSDSAVQFVCGFSRQGAASGAGQSATDVRIPSKSRHLVVRSDPGGSPLDQKSPGSSPGGATRGVSDGNPPRWTFRSDAAGSFAARPAQTCSRVRAPRREWGPSAGSLWTRCFRPSTSIPSFTRQCRDGVRARPGPVPSDS